MKTEFVSVITNNQGIIHKVCGVYCDTPEDREDLFQEIVTQLWKSYPSFRNESKVTTWMYRVALNTAITFFKKDKRRPDRGILISRSFKLLRKNMIMWLRSK